MKHPHDMGGRAGDGPVVPAPDGIAGYDAPWHRGALGLTLAAGAFGAWPIDAARAARERLSGYSSLSYYEKWIAALADLLVEHGLVSRAELVQGDAPPASLHPRALRAIDVPRVLAAGSPYARPGRTPAFRPGDSVQTRQLPENTLVRGGHVRLPRYAAGKTGRVVLSHGPHVFPDSNAHGRGEAPEPLYTVAFAAGALWDDAENPADEVTVDLWESYLARP